MNNDNGTVRVSIAQKKEVSAMQIRLKDIHSAEYVETVLKGVVNWVNEKADEARQQGADLIQLRYVNIPETLHNTDRKLPSIEMVAYRGLIKDQPLAKAFP